MEKKAMLFVGVSTSQSFVHRVFPKWCSILGESLELIGVDLPVKAECDKYREVVKRIRDSSAIRGALVTTHKTGIYQSSQDMFDYVERGAYDLHEAGALYKSAKGLTCEATDPFSVEWAIHEILTRRSIRSLTEVVILGGGGAGLALAYVLISRAELNPKRLTIIDVATSRVSEVTRVLSSIAGNIDCDVVLNESGIADSYVERLGEGSLIVNATGMGKDIPGSPLSVTCKVPRNCLLWDFNYRGERRFLSDAATGTRDGGVILEDGWYYFICGWFQVLTRVLGCVQDKDVLAKFVRVAEAERERNASLA